MIVVETAGGALDVNSLSNRVRPLSSDTGRRMTYRFKGLMGAMIGLALLLAVAFLLVVVAATLAVGTAVAAVLLALSALAWRVRPRPQTHGVRASASPVGHAWVVYRGEPPVR